MKNTHVRSMVEINNTLKKSLGDSYFKNQIIAEFQLALGDLIDLYFRKEPGHIDDTFYYDDNDYDYEDTSGRKWQCFTLSLNRTPKK